MSYSRMVLATLPSALSCFTTVFGMGTGGSNSLWPPGKLFEGSVLRLVSRIWVVVKHVGQHQCLGYFTFWLIACCFEPWRYNL